MILKEISVERLQFTCGGCGHTWSTDYDVQHVEDGVGHDRDYYFHDGLPSPDPTTPGGQLCPRCGRATLWVELVARRSSPAVTDHSGHGAGTRPSARTTHARGTAPLLPGAMTQEDS